MKVYIIFDMEGCSGIFDWRQVTVSDPASAAARRMATHDLNAVIQGAMAGGATEIVVWDGHSNYPGSLDLELLDPACHLIANAADGGPVGLDASFAAVFQCGLHAMAGTQGGVLAHSSTRSIASFSVNNLPMGEIGMNLLTAGSYGLPCVFISGDEAAVAEAQALVPGMVGVAVKRGLHPYGIVLRPAAEARAALRAGACQAVGRVHSIGALTMAKPYRMVTRWQTEEQAAAAITGPNSTLLDPLTVETVTADLQI